MMRRVLLGLALAVMASAVPAQVVINEFQYDDSGTDNREFVELYNTTNSPIVLDGYVLEGLDEAYPTDNNADYTIPLGSVIGPFGYFVIGAATVANVNFVIPGAGTNLWENGDACPETLLLRDSFGNLLDAVTYESTKTLAQGATCVVYPTQFLEGQGIWGNFTSIDATGQTWSRWQDGLDTGDNGRDFGLLPGTPGAANGPLIPAVPYLEGFEGLPVEANVPMWTGSFVNPRAVDPTMVSVSNPNVIPASPGAGQCMVLWDPAGGGDSALMDTLPQTDFLVEAYVYLSTSFFDPNGLNPDRESWSLGVRGTTDTFHNDPCPAQLCGSGALGARQNGNTGIAWIYQHFHSGGRLWLVDEGSGNDSETILGFVSIQPGVNDGWQRLRLEVAGDLVVGNFGGTYGNPNDGTVFKGLTTTNSVGSVYMGYREFVLVNANARPLTMDDLFIDNGATRFSSFLRQPTGPGSLQLENRGLTPGNETWNLFTFELCPGTPGTGPILGLCFTSPLSLSFLIDQINFPVGSTPFKFVPGSDSLTFPPTPLTGIGAGIPIEMVTFELIGGVSFGQISCVSSLVTQ